MNNQFCIFTDGSAIGNPGPAGWAAILLHGTKRQEIAGSVLWSTVSEMELRAAVEALRAEGAVVSDCLAIISYGFPEAVERFERAGIQLHAATTFQAVLESAVESKMIDEAGAAVVRDWLREPHSWAKRQGFE